MKTAPYLLTALTGVFSLLDVDHALAQGLSKSPDQKTIEAVRHDALTIGLDSLDDAVKTSLRDTVASYYNHHKGRDKDYNWHIKGQSDTFDVSASLSQYNIILRVRNADAHFSHVNLYSMVEGSSELISDFTVDERRTFADSSRYISAQRYRQTAAESGRFSLTEDVVTITKDKQHTVASVLRTDTDDTRYYLLQQTDESAFGDDFTRLSEISKYGYGLVDVNKKTQQKIMPSRPCHTMSCFEAFRDSADDKTHPSVRQRLATIMSSMKHYFQP